MEISSSERKRLKVSRMDHSDKPSSISTLPDGILCHILSFLPTKSTVATSILSKRWRFMWTHVPNFSLDSYNHHPDEIFPHIVNRVLLQQKSKTMTTFRLHYERGWITRRQDFEVETWITTAVARSVKNIHLFLYCHSKTDNLCLPLCLFTCKTLVDLKLICIVDIPIVGSVRLPNLKKLHISSIRKGSDKSFPHLSGCPVLEELIVDKMLMDDTRICRIPSSTIKRITINFEMDDIVSQNGKVEINAPALRYLKMEENCLSECMLTEPLNNLIEADIWFLNFGMESPYQYHISMLKFLDNLHNLKFLKLRIYFHKFDPGAFSRFSVFDNLTRLELAADWIFVTAFREAARNLEDLVIHEVTKDLSIWREPIEVPECLLFHLTTITIHRFDYAEPTEEFLTDRYKMVKYFLRNALVLKRMVICSKRGVIDWKAKFKALQRISSFERSTACLLTYD